jgi:putative ABC transport system ATP-binding protein
LFETLPTSRRERGPRTERHDRSGHFEFRNSNFEFIPRPPGVMGELRGKFEIRNSKSAISPFRRRSMITLRELWRTYHVGDSDVHALRDVTLEIGRGDYLAVMGPSGSGKSTLLNILGCLDRPTSGSYAFAGRDVGLLSDSERTRLRQSEIGFVFQFFHLLPRLTAQGNVELPMLFAGVSRAERRERAARALEAVGLSDRVHHRPDQLSGGQRQRVAIARAVVMEPGLLLADEPTGNLDRAAAVEVMELLGTMNADGQTVVLVTHDPEVGSRARSAVRMDDGAIVERR